MKYGNCVDIIAASAETLAALKADGYDFIEGALMKIAAATDEEFEAAVERVNQSGLKVEICNGMFPREVRLTAGINEDQVRDYVKHAFTRASVLGVKKIVLGSDKSRQLPDGYDEEKAYQEFSELVKNVIAPLCDEFDITVMIEPLRRPCNFINTLADGMRVVYHANHPKVQLLADTIHMMTSGEDPKYVHEILPYIKHVHVSDWNRVLPEYTYSTELSAVLREIKASGYDITMSFEAAAPSDEFGLKRALLILKQKMM